MNVSGNGDYMGSLGSYQHQSLVKNDGAHKGSQSSLNVELGAPDESQSLLGNMRSARANACSGVGRRLGMGALLGAAGVGALLLGARAGLRPMPDMLLPASNSNSFDGAEPLSESECLKVVGRQLQLDGKPHQIRGVCWNPVPIGGNYPNDIDYSRAADVDLPLMKNMGINTVRVYLPITDRQALDKIHAAGMKVVMPVLSSSADDLDSVIKRVEAVKDHPAIAMWCLGNEWNKNALYDPSLSQAEVLDRINTAAAAIRKIDTNHPIITSYGDVPEKSVIDAMPLIDVLGINIYDGTPPYRFGDRFNKLAEYTDKPAVFTEYGVDAWNANIDAYDPDTQAAISKNQTDAILENSTARRGGTLSGAFYFEWRDEWWKMGEPWVHNTDGIPGPDMYDGMFNEEWFGLYDIEGDRRPVQQMLAEAYRNDAAKDA